MRKKLSPHTAPGARAICEAFRFTEILDRLRGFAASDSKAGRRDFELLKRDPRHPSLQFKKVGRYWSVRVGLRYRALAVEMDGGYVWLWIGSHADYDGLAKGRKPVARMSVSVIRPITQSGRCHMLRYCPLVGATR